MLSTGTSAAETSTAVLSAVELSTAALSAVASPEPASAVASRSAAEPSDVSPACLAEMPFPHPIASRASGNRYVP
jgi:hypothetical protein